MQPIVSKSGDSKRRRAHQRLGNSTLGFSGMNSVLNNAKRRSQASSPVNRVASGATQNCKEPGTSIAISQLVNWQGGANDGSSLLGQVSVAQSLWWNMGQWAQMASSCLGPLNTVASRSRGGLVLATPTASELKGRFR